MIGLLTIFGQILILLFIVYWLLFKKTENKLTQCVVENAIFFAFIVAVVATSGSLYYSEIAKFEPCELCWLQRIFMYPQVILLGTALWKKENHVITYSLALIAVGIFISLYHNFTYYTVQSTNFCSISAPCTTKFVTVFNYISIPSMALTAFVLVGILLLNKKLRLIKP